MLCVSMGILTIVHIIWLACELFVGIACIRELGTK